MDVKIRDLCRSNLRENLKGLKKDDGSNDIPNEEEPAAEPVKEEKDLDTENEIYTIIQEALKRKSFNDAMSPTEGKPEAPKAPIVNQQAMERYI